MKRTLPIIFLLFAIRVSLKAGDFPEIKGWTPVSQVSTYGPDNLWEFIDGAAEQFLSYGFQELLVCDLSDGKVTMTVHIYTMGNPLNAFGIYRSERSGDCQLLAIGAEAVVLPPYQCLMLKGSNYVKVEAFEGEITQILGSALLKSIADALPGTDGFPDVFGIFPKENRIPHSEGFIRESFLGLSELRECVFVSYQMSGNQTVQVFSIHSDPENPLESYWKRLKEKWDPLEGNNHAALYKKIPYTGYVGVMHVENRILGVSAADDEAGLKKLLDWVAGMK
jgi:hypothetical protein